jgi:hypothetical protein
MGIIRRALKGQLETPCQPDLSASQGDHWWWQGGRGDETSTEGPARPRTQNQNMRGVVSPTSEWRPDLVKFQRAAMGFVMVPVRAVLTTDPTHNIIPNHWH